MGEELGGTTALLLASKYPETFTKVKKTCLAIMQFTSWPFIFFEATNPSLSQLGRLIK
jgi:hypothetical protein